MNKFEKDIEHTMPTFCAIPFVSMVVNTDATIQPCCMMKRTTHKLKGANGNVLTINDKLADAWNSNEMKFIRTEMVSGNKLEGCNVCYLQENSGRTSNRQYANSEWSNKLGNKHMFDLIDQSMLSGGELDYSLAYLDLRLGNLCNLKCRMCSPFNSSQIAKEHVELEKKDAKYKKVWAQTFGTFNPRINEVQSWFERDFLWDQIIDLIPSLKKVYMTGGEPTLIQNNFKFMEECIRQGRKDVVMFFNTNCTNVNKKFTNLIGQFNRVNINASIDGTEMVNDYIRSPSHWEQISTNVETLAQMSNVTLGITPTVQVYNIFNLVDTLKWVDKLNAKYKKNIFVDFLINVHPTHLSVGILPDPIRNRVADDLIEYKNTYLNSNSPALTINSVNGIIGLLQRPRAADWQEQLSRFKTYTHSLDVEREQSIRSISTELADLINEE
jgi:sulfatase maturation enzyme AslB (radical SAM superfamily)